MSKYRNVPTMIDNVRFASKREGRRYAELKLLQQIGKIAGLIVDKSKLRYPLAVSGQQICTYEADFSYLDENNEVIVEDVKGLKTPVYKIKKKLMKAIYGIEIREV